MICVNSMDFEEQLDSFFVRKANDFPDTATGHKKACKQQNHSTYVKNCVPLMLKHVKSLNENWQDTGLIKIFSDKLQFKNCLLYGKIIVKTKETTSSQNYVLDDGTASLDVTLFKRTDDLKAIWKLENELQSVRKELMTQNKNEIVDCLRNLLFKTKEQIDNANIPIGSNILLYGKPTCYRGQISFIVYCFLKDEKSNRDMEISFKDYLINWYRNNCVFVNV